MEARHASCLLMQDKLQASLLVVFSLEYPKSLVARNSAFLGRNVLGKGNCCVCASATDHYYEGYAGRS